LNRLSLTVKFVELFVVAADVAYRLPMKLEVVGHYCLVLEAAVQVARYLLAKSPKPCIPLPIYRRCSRNVTKFQKRRPGPVGITLAADQYGSFECDIARIRA
jgi:hypothetical protein